MNRGVSATAEALRTVVLVIFIALIIRAVIFQPFVVEGASMVPTFHDRDYLIVNKFLYYFESPQRGEVIVFHSPTVRNTDFIKRVIGLPGDLVRIDNGQLFINGTKITEAYTNHEATANGSLQPTTIERFLNQREYWVMGDNRNHSSDSRDWGPLQQSAIIGKATITVFPPSDFGLVKTPSYSLGRS